MPGKLQGAYFKHAFGAMRMGRVLFPALAARVDALKPDGWYGWDEYLAMIDEVARRVPPLVLTTMGSHVFVQSKPAFVALGFDTLDAIAGNLQGLFAVVVYGAPPQDVPRTVAFEPHGRAVFEAGLAQPAALVEGYLRGAVGMFGRHVTVMEVTREERGGSAVNRFVVAWE